MEGQTLGDPVLCHETKGGGHCVLPKMDAVIYFLNSIETELMQ